MYIDTRVMRADSATPETPRLQMSVCGSFPSHPAQHSGLVPSITTHNTLPLDVCTLASTQRTYVYKVLFYCVCVCFKCIYWLVRLLSMYLYDVGGDEESVCNCPVIIQSVP